MPEGPELLTSARYLTENYVGRDVVVAGPTKTGRWKTNPPPGFEKFQKILATSKYSPTLESVNVKGKFMWWKFLVENRDIYMMCTYGMSGQWIPIAGTDSKHAGFFFFFRDASGDTRYLSFVDPRHFGTIKFIFDRHEIGRKLKTLGTDPLTEPLDAKSVKELLNSKETWKKTPICELLLDQRLFAGVGNYIRAEALWRASIDPWKTPDKLDFMQYDALCREIHAVMKESLEDQGATIHTYSTPDGKDGKFEFNVFGKSEDVLGNRVETKRDANGRNVHWAPAKQR